MNLLIIGAAISLVVILLEATYLTVMKFKQRKLKVARGSLLIDTCSVMDGRIVDLAKSGIITAEVIVPRSVINELQLLADKADHDKRIRARKGLDNVRELQRMDSVSVAIVNDGRVGKGGVDERLLELAKNYDASIATTDYNLNKVAKVMDITVINVNEIAQMMRAQHFPGDKVEIELIQPGANRDQAVGYLEDGTMVVVEDSRGQIGQKLNVEIIRSLQTEAGRMMFAKRWSRSHNDSNSGNPNSHNRTSARSKDASDNTSTTTSPRKAATSFHSDQLKQRRSGQNIAKDNHLDSKSGDNTKKDVESHEDTSNKNEPTSASPRSRTNAGSKRIGRISQPSNSSDKSTAVSTTSSREPAKVRRVSSSSDNTKLHSSARRRTSKSAEASMVRLANMANNDNSSKK